MLEQTVSNVKFLHGRVMEGFSLIFFFSCLLNFYKIWQYNITMNNMIKYRNFPERFPHWEMLVLSRTQMKNSNECLWGRSWIKWLSWVPFKSTLFCSSTIFRKWTSDYTNSMLFSILFCCFFFFFLIISSILTDFEREINSDLIFPGMFRACLER